VLLGQLPLDAHIREQADSGQPTVVAMPESDLAARYKAIARKVGAAVAQAARRDPKRIDIVFE
jgi:ATP-binding protein involved in chromosome partitioning